MSLPQILQTQKNNKQANHMGAFSLTEIPPE